MQYADFKRKQMMSNVISGDSLTAVEGALPLILADSIGEDIEDYRIYGESVQDGDPTPSTPIEVESVGYKTNGEYKIPVVVSGKNLFDMEGQTWSTGLLNASTGALNTGNSNYKTTDYISIIKPNENYVVSFNQNYTASSGTSNRICYYDSNKGFISCNDTTQYTTAGRKDYLLNVPSNASYIRYSVRVTDTDIQIEFGTIATEYETYKRATTTNIYLDEPLRKIGDYADYIDFKNGKVVRNIGKHVWTGDESSAWKQGSGSNNFYTSTSSYAHYKANSVMLWDIYKFYEGRTYSPWYPSANYHFNNYTAVGSSTREIYVHDADYNNVDEFKANLVGSTIYYVHDNPTEEVIELPVLETVEEDCVFSIDTTVKGNAMVKYYKGE